MPSRVVTWRDLWVILLLAPPDSAFARAVAGCGHTASEHLALLQVHVVNVGNWQRAHGKKNTAPKLPVCMRPEDEQPTKYGTSSMTIEEAAEWLGWPTPSQN